MALLRPCWLFFIDNKCGLNWVGLLVPSLLWLPALYKLTLIDETSRITPGQRFLSLMSKVQGISRMRLSEYIQLRPRIHVQKYKMSLAIKLLFPFQKIKSKKKISYTVLGALQLT